MYPLSPRFQQLACIALRATAELILETVPDVDADEPIDVPTVETYVVRRTPRLSGEPHEPRDRPMDHIPIIYHLSNKQRKALLISGTELQLALPIPPGEVADWASWAASVLPTEFRPMITAAEDRELFVEAIRKTDNERLSSHLGAIVDPTNWGDETPRLCQCVIACIVTLTPPNCRRKQPQPQWPHKVVFHGQELPAA